MFTFFLLIYSRCGVPASWAVQHTIVCLDMFCMRISAHGHVLVLIVTFQLPVNHLTSLYHQLMLLLLV